MSSAEGGIREKIKCRSTPDGCTGTRWSFLIMLGVSKKGLSSSATLFVSQCAVRLEDKPQNTAGNGQSCSGSLYVRYSELRNESQGESRKRVAGESLPDDLIKFMITDAETSRPEQKPSTPKAKKKTIKEEKPQEDIEKPQFALIILSCQKVTFP